MRRNKLSTLLGVAMMMEAMTNPTPTFSSTPVYYDRKEWELKLLNYKHSGPIPKGCQLEVVKIDLKKNGQEFYMIVDVVYGSLKAKQKRITKYRNEIEEYVSRTLLADIKRDSRFLFESSEEI